jgi:hypothetical protein
MKQLEQKHLQKSVIESHQTDLKEAITYLPRNFDQDTLFRALKAVYGEEGNDIAKEWLIKSKNYVSIDFQSKWDKATLTRYQQVNFDTWISQNIYDIAEKIGWVPKALRKGKQSKRPPSRRKQKRLEDNLGADSRLEQYLVETKEKDRPEQEKSYIGPCIVNKFGACYKHPFMRNSDIPESREAYIHKLDKLVDCEVRILEACEYIIEKYGREPDEIDVKYRIELTNRADKQVIAQVTHEELTTKTRFSSFLVSKGIVKFQGNTRDFDKFHNFILKEGSYPTVQIPASWGQYRPGVFLFENGIFCTHSNMFYPADDQQRIAYNGKLVACPTGSQQVMPPKLQQVQTDSVSFLRQTFSLWESFNGSLNIRSTIGYAVACVFSRQIMEELRGFPMLFNFGVRATGKSTSMDWFMALFGYRNGNRQSVSKQNTLKGINRRMTLPNSFPFFLDDYRNTESNSNVPDLTSSFLNWYQRIGTGMAKKSTDQSTIDTHMNACVVMTGNDKPIDPAALSRLIILNFNRHIKNNEIQKVQCIANQTDRLSEFLSLILENYERVREAFFNCLKIHRDYLSQKNFDGRTVNNWGIILAGVESVGEILPDLGWHEELDTFREDVCQAIRKEQDLEHSQNKLIEFFDTLNYYAAEKKHPDAGFKDERYVLDRRHFQITQYEPKDPPKDNSYYGQALALHLPGIWNVLKDFGSDITHNTIRSSIEARIQNCDLFLERSAHVYMHENHKNLNKKNRRCYLLNLELLEEHGLLEDLIEKARQYKINS